jgi:hypothetical protein
MDTYKLVSTAVSSDVNVKVSSDTGKGNVSEAVTTERASPVHKHSQQFFPDPKLLATKSSIKNLFVVNENKHARERNAANRQQSNEDITATLSLELHEQS